MTTSVTGQNPQNYLGVNAPTPPNITKARRAPTENDIGIYMVGDLWLQINKDPEPAYDVWMLADVSRVYGQPGGVATWIHIYPQGSSGAIEFDCDTGFAIPVLGHVNVFGGGHIQTIGDNVKTITITTDGDVATQFTTDDASIAIPANNNIFVLGDNNIITSATASTIDIELSNGTDGQVLIGGGVKPLWANITSIDTSVTIVNGEHSIDLSVPGSGGSNQGFMAFQNASDKYNTISNDPYYFGSSSVLYVQYNNGNNFYPGDGLGTRAAYTVPADGIYYLSLTVLPLKNIQGGSFVSNVMPAAVIETSTDIYYSNGGSWAATAANANSLTPSITAITLQLTAGEIIWFSVVTFISGGNFENDYIIEGGGGIPNPTPYPGKPGWTTNMFGYLIS